MDCLGRKESSRRWEEAAIDERMKRLSQLSDKERIVLSHSALNADISVKELSKRTGMRQHAVRYIQDSLLSRGLIVPVYHIDLFSLGYLDFTVFFNRGAESSVGQKRLERHILSHPNVLGFSRMGGGYRHMLWFVVKQLYEVDDIFTLLRPTEVGAHFEKTVRVALDWTVYNPQYLTQEKGKRYAIALSSRTEIVHVDSKEQAILRGLSQHPGASLLSISRSLQMSSTSLNYHVAKLKEQGVIRGLTYILQNDRLGIQTYRVLITDGGLSAEQKMKFRHLCELCPNVVACLMCTGNWDYELRFETENSEELDSFCQALYDAFGSSIGTIKALPQFQILKRLGHPLASQRP